MIDCKLNGLSLDSRTSQLDSRCSIFWGEESPGSKGQGAR